MAKKMVTVRRKGGTFNLKYGRSDQVVRNEVIRLLEHDPLFLCVQEADDYWQQLNNIPGYEYYATRAYAGGTESGILVRKGVKTSNAKYTSEGDGWITVRGGHHAPSTMARVTIDGWLRVASIHAPTPSVWINGQLSAPAERYDDYMALMRGVRDFLSESSQVRIVAGDWNEPPSTTGKWAPAWVANQTGAKIQAPNALAGHGRIDYPIAKNCRLVEVWKDLQIAEGSDHEPVIFTFEARIEADEDEEPPKHGGGGGGGQGQPNPPPYNPPPEGPPPPPSAHSGRGRATLGGKPFRLNPTSVDWTFDAKVADIATIGGKVVQVLGTNISDLRLSGTFGAGGWREQAEFLDWIKELADRGVKSQKPIRFRYPTYGWDFPVLIKAYTTPDGGRSIVLDNNIVAPRWDLVLFVVEGSASLDKIAKDAFIARLSKGLGWKQTKFNGPKGLHALSDLLGGMSVEEYLEQQYGIGSVPTGNQDYEADPVDVGPLPSGGTPDRNRQLGQALASRLYGWTGAEWTALEKLWTAESGWNHLAENPSSGAYGIPQSLPGSKMATVGSDWRTNPVTQIKWGLKYIKERSDYGSPSRAWALWQSRDPHWY